MHLNGQFSSELELQQKLDFIYEKSKCGGSFHGIIEVASNEVTITTAIHNIKSNKGANTAGIDKVKMSRYLKMDRNKLIALVQSAFTNYRPKPVKRVYILKSNGKKRPLGIPTVLDRIVQECLRIVLEPLVEAKFFPNSYGFRPYRSVHDAVYMVFHYANGNAKNKPWTVIEGDIRGFFDNINHKILLDKLWKIGVHDRRVLAIIRAMLKAGYIENGIVSDDGMGTPQGGILSPLLANVYLNSFDWYVGRMYQTPRQKAALPEADRALLRYHGIVPKYLVRYADDWVILTNNGQEADRLLHKLSKYFTHRLKIELSQEKTIITDMRESAVTFLGFDIKVRDTVYKPERPVKKMAMCYPNPQKLQKSIRMLCDEVKQIRFCPDNVSKAVQIEAINTKIIGLAEHYKHVLSSEAYHKLDYAVNKCAFKTFRRMYKKRVLDHVIPLGQLSNRPQRHAGRRDVAMAVSVHGMWVGLTKAYITGSNRINRPYHQATTPYTQEGRLLNEKRTKKRAPLVRPALYDGTNQLDFTTQNPLYNFEYYMNREYAFNRDKGVCRCCRTMLTTGHRHCHHVVKSLAIAEINKVSNLAWVCNQCHDAIHGKSMPSYATGSIKRKIEQFQTKLAKPSFS